MSKRLASEVEQDGLAATAQAVWALITGQRNQIEGLEAATSGSMENRTDFLMTARLVSPESRRSIDDQTVRIRLCVMDWPGPNTNMHLIARVSRTLADQLDEAALLPDYANITGPVAQFVRSYTAHGDVWIVSRHRTTLYTLRPPGIVVRYMGYTRDYGVRMLNVDREIQEAR